MDCLWSSEDRRGARGRRRAVEAGIIREACEIMQCVGGARLRWRWRRPPPVHAIATNFFATPSPKPALRQVTSLNGSHSLQPPHSERYPHHLVMAPFGRTNPYTRSFLVGCLNSCLQGTNVRVISPLAVMPSSHRTFPNTWTFTQ